MLQSLLLLLRCELIVLLHPLLQVFAAGGVWAGIVGLALPEPLHRLLPTCTLTLHRRARPGRLGCCCTQAGDKCQRAQPQGQGYAFKRAPLYTSACASSAHCRPAAW